MKKIINKIKSINSLDELNATELASMIKYLIEHEVEPGGPYTFIGENEEWLNSHIYKLFADKGKKLNPSMAPISATETTKDAKTQPNDLSSAINHNLYQVVSLNIHSFLNKSDLNEFNNILNKVQKADKTGEISNLSSSFYSSLKSNHRSAFPLSRSRQTEYSLANIYTWTAYSIIDTLLDTDFKAKLLPIVGMLQRKIVHHYLKAGINFELIEELFNSVDSANIIELKLRKNIEVDIEKNIVIIHNVDFGGIDKLTSQKSIAHCMGPISIVDSIDASSFYDIRKAMELYCEARQLNDDLHDWMEDFSNGEVTYVISELIKASSIRAGKYNFEEILEQLKETYWSEMLIYFCKKIESDILESVRLLEKNLLKKDSSFTTKFLIPISISAQQARNRHAFDKRFFESMSGK